MATLMTTRIYKRSRKIFSEAETIKGLNRAIIGGEVIEPGSSFSYKLCVNKTVTVAYSCVGQAVIIIIIVVSVKFEQWHMSSTDNKRVFN